MASGSVGTDLFKTIKYQATMTVPSILICAVIYFIWGATMDSSTADISTIGEVIGGIDAHYKLGFVTVIPLVVVLVMLLLKVPSIPLHHQRRRHRVSRHLAVSGLHLHRDRLLHVERICHEL